MWYIIFIMCFTTAFCMEKSTYKSPLDEKRQQEFRAQKAKPLPPIPVSKGTSTTQESEKKIETQERSYSPKIQEKPVLKTTEEWKFTSETDTVKKLIDEGLAKTFKQQPAVIAFPKSRETTVSQDVSISSIKLSDVDGLVTRGTFKPTDQWTPADKRVVMVGWGKLNNCDESYVKSLSAEDKLKAQLIVQARITQITNGLNQLADNTEKLKSLRVKIENTPEIKQLANDMRANGKTEDEIKKAIDASVAQYKKRDPYKKEGDQLDAQFESIKEKYGFDQTLDRRGLEDATKKGMDKADNLLGMLGDVKDIRKNAMSDMAMGLRDLLKRKKSLNDAEQATLKEKGNSYCKTFVELYSDSTMSPKEKLELLKSSKSIRSKLRSQFIADQQNQAKNIRTEIETLNKSIKSQVRAPGAKGEVILQAHSTAEEKRKTYLAEQLKYLEVSIKVMKQ